MKTITAKKNKVASVRRKPQVTKPRKAAVKTKPFRFAPDAIGMMQGPADLSTREGFIAP